MDKFNRNYILSIQKNILVDPNQGYLIIKPPFTLEFDVRRNTFSSASSASFRVYNLSKDNRNSILRNWTDFAGANQRLALLAGYGDGPSFPLIADVHVNQCWSVREGTDYITQIEGFDGGFAYSNSFTDRTYKSGTSQAEVIEDLIKDLQSYGVVRGSIGEYSGDLPRGTAISGNTTEVLTDLTDGAFFIDNGKAYVLKDNECIQGEITVINSQSGLLGTPVRENLYVQIEMIFEPRLRIGQLINLESITGDNQINGAYKVVGVHHKGTISDAVAGTVTTTLQLAAPHGLKVVSDG